jgi:hypothetical protein
MSLSPAAAHGLKEGFAEGWIFWTYAWTLLDPGAGDCLGYVIETIWRTGWDRFCTANAGSPHDLRDLPP